MRDADLTTLDLDASNEDGHRAYDLLRIRNGTNWELYCQDKGIRMSWLELYDEGDWSLGYRDEERKDEPRAICALEQLLHYVQKCQNVPEAERYPPLGRFLSRDGEGNAVPGAWPAYG